MRLLLIQSTNSGLDKLALNDHALKNDLNNHWEILAEPIQTIMRKHGISNAYELLKNFTRGKQLSQDLLHQFIDEQNLPYKASDRTTKAIKP